MMEWTMTEPTNTDPKHPIDRLCAEAVRLETTQLFSCGKANTIKTIIDDAVNQSYGPGRRVTLGETIALCKQFESCLYATFAADPYVSAMFDGVPSESIHYEWPPEFERNILQSVRIVLTKQQEEKKKALEKKEMKTKEREAGATKTKASKKQPLDLAKIAQDIARRQKKSAAAASVATIKPPTESVDATILSYISQRLGSDDLLDQNMFSGGGGGAPTTSSYIDMNKAKLFLEFINSCFVSASVFTNIPPSTSSTVYKLPFINNVLRSLRSSMMWYPIWRTKADELRVLSDRDDSVSTSELGIIAAQTVIALSKVDTSHLREPGVELLLLTILNDPTVQKVLFGNLEHVSTIISNMFESHKPIEMEMKELLINEAKRARGNGPIYVQSDDS